MMMNISLRIPPEKKNNSANPTLKDPAADRATREFEGRGWVHLFQAVQNSNVPRRTAAPGA